MELFDVLVAVRALTHEDARTVSVASEAALSARAGKLAFLLSASRRWSRPCNTYFHIFSLFHSCTVCRN